jgi:hypothetical protein
MMMDGFPAFSKAAALVLQSILSDESKILLTTSHRNRFNSEEWKEIFKLRGITVNHLIIPQEMSNSASRKEEIIDWIKPNMLTEPFVILDDDTSLNDLPDFLKAKLVQPSSHIGLTEKHLREIDRILLRDLRSFNPESIVNEGIQE